MLKPIWSFFVLLSILLMQTSCQTIENNQATNSSVLSQAKTHALTSSKLKNKKSSSLQENKDSKIEQNLPNHELTEEILFFYLLGELAKQNTDYLKSFEHFYRLAVKTNDPRLAKSALRVALKSNNDEITFKAIQFWTKLEPISIDAVQIRAVVLLKIKKDDLAKESILKLFQLIDNNKETMSRLGVLLSSLNDYSRIKPILMEVHSYYPNDYYVDLYTAKFALKFNDYPQTEKSINQALSVKPNDETSILIKATLYKKMALPDKQLQVYEDSISRIDNTDKGSLIRLEYVKLLLKTKQRQKALEQLEYIVNMNKTNSNILYSIGMLAMEIKEYSYARDYFAMLYQLKDHKNQAAFLLGILAYKEEKNKLALDWFAKVNDKKYEYESILRMAIILAEDKQYSKALKILDTFFAELLKTPPSKNKDKRHLNILRLQADILYQAELFNQAYQTYTQALQFKPKDAELLYSRAMVAEKLGKIDLSEQDLLSIIKDDPKNSSAFNALGFILTERTTRYDDAKKYIAKALQIMPNDMAILDSMGWVLYKMGRIQESLTYLKKAYEFKQDPEVAAHYGEALWAAGKKKQAEEIWQTALIDNPEHIVLKSTIHTYMTP